MREPERTDFVAVPGEDGGHALTVTLYDDGGATVNVTGYGQAQVNVPAGEWERLVARLNGRALARLTKRAALRRCPSCDGLGQADPGHPASHPGDCSRCGGSGELDAAAQAALREEWRRVKAEVTDGHAEEGG